MFIYKTLSGITVYDLNKIIPIRFAGMLASSSKYKLNKLFEESYKSFEYYDILQIKGADESTIDYIVDDNFSRFILSLIKPLQSTEDTNIFQLSDNVNIGIVGTKSFNIFRDLLSGKINQMDIVNKIFEIGEIDGMHNMMSALMNHIYEFTKVIVLKGKIGSDKNDNNGEYNPNHPSVRELKVRYIGYILIVLILKYYSMLLKKTQLYESTKKYMIKFDIIETFNKNFPVFKNFMDKSMAILIGEKLDDDTSKCYNKKISI
jgi:hypothetical protein